MKARKLLGGLMVTVCSGLLVASQFGAGVVGAEPADEDPNNAATSSEIETKELCIWYVEGVAASFSMSAAAGEPAEYDGTEYALTSGDTIGDVNIYVSGNETPASKDAHADCTFYGAAQGIAYKGAIAAGGFTAAATGGDDDDMDFDPTADLPLTLDVTKESCRSLGAVGGDDSWSEGDLVADDASGVAATSLVSLTKANVVSPQSDTNAENSACTAGHVLTVTVPANLTPNYAGQNYTLTGPTFTLSFDILDE
jgi:hypothetical protein